MKTTTKLQSKKKLKEKDTRKKEKNDIESKILNSKCKILNIFD